MSTCQSMPCMLVHTMRTTAHLAPWSHQALVGCEFECHVRDVLQQRGHEPREEAPGPHRAEDGRGGVTGAGVAPRLHAPDAHRDRHLDEGAAGRGGRPRHERHGPGGGGGEGTAEGVVRRAVTGEVGPDGDPRAGRRPHHPRVEGRHAGEGAAQGVAHTCPGQGRGDELRDLGGAGAGAGLHADLDGVDGVDGRLGRRPRQGTRQHIRRGLLPAAWRGQGAVSGAGLGRTHPVRRQLTGHRALTWPATGCPPWRPRQPWRSSPRAPPLFAACAPPAGRCAGRGPGGWRGPRGGPGWPHNCRPGRRGA